MLLQGTTPTYPGISSLNQVISKMIDEGQALDLERWVLAEEIKASLFNIRPKKAPGPDGYNAFFFRRTWHIIGDDIIKAV